MTKDKVLAWHFLPNDGEIRRGKWRNRKVRAGVTYVHRGPVVLCESGLHASIRAIDALEYAPGNIVCRVRCSDRVVHDNDKLVCGRRRVLWMADATRALHEFAIWCAEQALSQIDEPDPRSLRALEVKRMWLAGDATDKDLAAALDAALDAAWAAAWDAQVRHALEAARWLEARGWSEQCPEVVREACRQYYAGTPWEV